MLVLLKGYEKNNLLTFDSTGISMNPLAGAFPTGSSFSIMKPANGKQRSIDNINKFFFMLQAVISDSIRYPFSVFISILIMLIIILSSDHRSQVAFSRILSERDSGFNHNTIESGISTVNSKFTVILIYIFCFEKYVLCYKPACADFKTVNLA